MVKKTLLVMLLLFLSTSFALSGVPERFMLYFSEARIIFQPSSKNMQLITGNTVLSYCSDWQKAQVYPYLYHIRQNNWRNFYFKVNTSRKEVYLVEGTNFGRIGDANERKLPFSVAVNGGSDTVAPTDFLIEFGNRGCYLIYAPPSGTLQIAAVTNLGSDYPAVVLSYGADWQKCKIKDFLFTLKQNNWANFFWKINTSRKEVYRIEGVPFCQMGGNESKLPIQVEVFGDTGSEEALRAPRQLSPRCGIQMTNYPRTFTMQWENLGSGIVYDVEVDCFHCRQVNRWDSEVGGAHQINNINSNQTTFTFWGDNQGRWRVRAKKGSQVSEWSPWCEFSFKTGGSSSNTADLTIRISKCPNKVKSGTNLNDSFDVFVTNNSSEKLENIPLDIVLRSKGNCVPNPGFATYSETYFDGVLLKGGREHITLKPGETVKVKLNGSNQIPKGMRPGVYFLCAVIDPANKVAETNENNNCACCQVMIF